MFKNMKNPICVEIDGVFYESLTSAGRIIKSDRHVIKDKCLSDDFPNYQIVPFKITYDKKRCNECGELKLLKEFPIERSSKDNHATKCKKCCKIREDKWRENNSEHMREYRVNYYKDNLKDIKEYRNQPEIKAKKNKRAKERRETDIAYKINGTMRNGIRNSLKNGKGWAHWEDLVDYNLEGLMAHLESKFTEGMSWDNYGHGRDKWNIDHIIPVSSFNIISNTCQEFKDCWALDNLQPLWATRNYEKSDKPMEPKYLIKPDGIK